MSRTPSPRESEALVLTAVFGLTETAAGKRMGVSKQRAHRAATMARHALRSKPRTHAGPHRRGCMCSPCQFPDRRRGDRRQS